MSDGSEMRVERRKKEKKMGESGFLWEARDRVDAGWQSGHVPPWRPLAKRYYGTAFPKQSCLIRFSVLC